MGVSLERVQFKFASIIGELCNEPFILSQFAVWLDLRLAEYKSRGSISLDCCGFLPDPDWLKGLRPSSTSMSHFEDMSPTGDKGDSFHALSSNSVDTTPHCFSVNIQSVPKMYSNSANTGDRHDTRQTKKMDPNRLRQGPSQPCSGLLTRELLREPSPDVAMVMIEEEVIDLSPSGQEDQGRELVTNGNKMPSSHLASEHGDSAATQMTLNNNRNLIGTSSIRNCLADQSARLGVLRNSYHGNLRPADRSGGRRNSTARNITAAVSSFQRWLREEPYQDNRKMEDIPATELDVYLADFFSRVKKPSGQDYTRRSYEVYRYSLDRYLKEQGYPHSICKSRLFSRSQAAFCNRKQSLCEVAVQRSYPLSSNSQFSASSASGADVIGGSEGVKFLPNVTDSTAGHALSVDNLHTGNHGDVITSEPSNASFMDINNVSCSSPQESKSDDGLLNEGNSYQSKGSELFTRDQVSSLLGGLSD